MIDKILSTKLSIAGFLCTLMVVYRHSLNYLAFFNSWSPHGVSGFVEGVFMRLTQIAVPYFFMVSGFFFLGRDYYEPRSYIRMIGKKVHTLLIPFVIWNVAGALCLLPFDKDGVGTDFLSGVLNLLTSHWYGPLWYVRDLMMVMVLYPVYGWLFRIKSPLPLLLVVAVFFYLWIPIDCFVLSSECLFFFALGGFLSKYPEVLTLRMRFLPTMAITAIWLVACITGLMNVNEWTHKLTDMIGLVAFWQILNYMPDMWYRRLLVLSSFSFLIYVTHFYPMKLLKQGIAHFFPGNDMAALLTYLLLPILISWGAIVLGRLWMRVSKKTYSIATGNRT